MLGWESSAARRIRFTNPTSKRSQGGQETPKDLSFKVDNESIAQPQLGKAFFKTDGTKLECL
jgi:hypothetical protein